MLPFLSGKINECFTHTPEKHCFGYTSNIDTWCLHASQQFCFFYFLFSGFLLFTPSFLCPSEQLLEFMHQLPAFANMTMSVRRDLCSVMVFEVVEQAGTVILHNKQEVIEYSFSVYRFFYNCFYINIYCLLRSNFTLQPVL